MATTSTGAGVSSGGTSPFGVGTPATATAPPEKPADTAAFIDFQFSKDYEFDDEGELKRMPVQRQRVALALTETRGSSTARPNDGRERPTKVDERWESAEADGIRSALRQMTDVERSLAIDAIDAERDADGVTGRTRTTLTYTDLTNGEDDAIGA